MSTELLERFTRVLERYLSKGSSILLAVSGGVDSIVMLDLFDRAKRLFNLRIAVATFNHKLRKEAYDEVLFVESICYARNIDFFKGEGDVKEYAEKNKLSTEEAARILRYDFLNAIAQRYSFGYIATAHNSNDLLETMILRLVKGTGPFGLAAIKPLSGKYLRPLLFFSREELENYANQMGLKYVVDKSNFDIQYNRNFLRHKVIPLFKEINPSVEDASLKLAKSIWELDDYIENTLRSLSKDVTKIAGRVIFKLLDDEYLQIEQIRREALSFFGKPVDFEKLERFKKTKKTGKTSFKISLWGNLGIEISYGWCMMGDIHNYPVYEHVVCLDQKADKKSINVNGYFITFSYCDIISNRLSEICLKVRNWKEGDRVDSEKKVKEIFSKKKLPTFVRKLIPVVVFQDFHQKKEVVVYIPYVYEGKDFLKEYGISIEAKGGLHFES
ncbi:MAG: tRNA lysidine(34) synthetase TilS [Fervidobacterium sp.]